jgi:hypothetical protein
LGALLPKEVLRHKDAKQVHITTLRGGIRLTTACT